MKVVTKSKGKFIVKEKESKAEDKGESKAVEKAESGIKKSGTFEGKSNTLGSGGRAAQLKAKGVPGGVIGELARKAQAAPGQKNFHKN